MSDAARAELSYDVVKIDPDELRDYHPRVKEFQSANPYTWSNRTHIDAGQWADELRDAAVAGKKNFIFDTTLSDGPWTADLIRDLQAKGYDVEVRAVAAHKLESEHGVDERFSKKLDEFGHARHVPAGARDAIYPKVPASLDTIHAQTDVPIRIFSREGAELYDSRTDARLPGQVLEEARETRLRDPRITRDLSRGWQAQTIWHENLPEAIARNLKVASETAPRVLAEREAGGVVDGVLRDAAQARQIDHVTRVRPNVARGLGVVATAATAYDIADTTHDVSRLRAQGNATAAEDRITRFAAQNLGGWGGAAAGFGVGAMAGVKSGPGLLVTGTVGGIVGAMAGDQVADWIRERKINRQDDRHGNTWTFDPDHPERGWIRSEREIDVEATRYSTRDAPIYQARTLVADAALSDALTYKASSKSIELALGAPPQSRDPYRIAVSAAEQVQRQPFETGRVWTCDPQTRQWRQEIREVLDSRIPTTRHEPVSPQQAEALEQRSQAIIAHNARQTPAAMAAQFQGAYEQNGWAQHGSLPKAVTDALRHPGKVVGSDGALYERNVQGQWTHDGMLWDSQAPVSLRHELEATYQRQQADESIPTLETVQVRPGPELTQAASAPPQTSVPTMPDPARSIATLQSGLIQLGYHRAISQPLAVNGVNDDATRQAVTAFQAKQDLPITSTFDAATQQALQQALLTQQQATEQRQTEDKTREQERAEKEQKTKEQARSEELLPYSDPNSPQHAHRADLAQRSQAAGVNLTEEQLTLGVAQLQAHHIQPGWEGGVTVHDGILYVSQYMPPEHFRLDTRQPAPPVQETLQQAVTQQREHAEEIARMEAMPKIHGPTLGPGGPGGMPSVQG